MKFIYAILFVIHTEIYASNYFVVVVRHQGYPTYSLFFAVCDITISFGHYHHLLLYLFLNSQCLCFS